MAEIRDLAERAWQGELGEINVHPGRVRVGYEEFAERLGFMSAFSNVLVVDTDEGLVFVDTSSFFHAQQLFDGVRRWSKARVHTGIYTHGHVDHVFGLLHFDAEAKEKGWPDTRIIAHEACPARFDRYKLTNGYNGVINARQFGFPRPIFPKEYRYPESTFSSVSSMTLRIYPWMPLVALFSRGVFPSDRLVPDIESPILMVHGTADTIIPIAEGRKLHQAAAPGAEFLVVEGAHHNDFFMVAGDEYLIGLGKKVREWVGD